MIIEDVVQGTPEWYKIRLGIPTASCFDKLVTTTGIPSKQRQKYMYQLAAERITGIGEDNYQSAAMLRGKIVEEEARNMYAFITGNEVKQIGFCYHDKTKLYGCSPDGLISKDGQVEIKCPTSPVHIGYLLSGKFPTTYFQQTQGQLFITGRKWVDFFSYYPGLKPMLIRIKPDNTFILSLKVELDMFCRELDEVTEKLRSA